MAVRGLALESLAKRAPAEVVKRAATLLDTPNDLVRYAVCKQLANAGARVPPAAVHKLEQLVRQPSHSRNPNVLRINAARALGGCGGPTAVAALAEHAASGNIRNGLTGVAVDAVRDIGVRDKRARAEAARILSGAFPQPVEAGSRMERSCQALARRVLAALQRLTGRAIPFPATYDAAARTRLIRAFR